jgi:hypothetical protein
MHRLVFINGAHPMTTPANRPPRPADISGRCPEWCDYCRRWLSWALCSDGICSSCWQRRQMSADPIDKWDAELDAWHAANKEVA